MNYFHFSIVNTNLKGRQYGPDGNLAQWWTPTSEKNYLDREQCIINQYGNYSFPELEMSVTASHFFFLFLP